MVRDPIFPVVKSSRGDKANPGEMSNHNTRRCETGGPRSQAGQSSGQGPVAADKAEGAPSMGSIQLRRAGRKGLPGREGKRGSNEHARAGDGTLCAQP